MSKCIPATCAAGIVMAEGFPVPSAIILTKGTGPSTGILVLDEDDAWYVATNTTDLSTALDQVASALTTVGSALTAIGAMMTGPTTAPPPTLPTSVASLTAASAALTTLKGLLK